jgi:hypothetical protein
MELRLGVMSKGTVFGILLACVALGLPSSLKLQSDFHSPASALVHMYPVTDLKNHKNRAVALHGPDWVLESSVIPACLPEKEVVFATEVGRGMLPHPFTARTRLWITEDHDVTHVRIVDSSAASREQDMIAVSFATNHKCIDRTSQNCSVKGGAAFIRVD